MNIGNLIIQYPKAVQIPSEPFGYRTIPWAEFADANPDISADVAIQIAVHGSAKVGGGASPEITILRG